LLLGGSRGLLQLPEAKFIAIYRDNPDITDEKNLRTDICITVPPGTQVSGEIGLAVIPAGKNAVAHFEINPSQYGMPGLPYMEAGCRRAAISRMTGPALSFT
jgi:DNA gyrase inhibitor GyrI